MEFLDPNTALAAGVPVHDIYLHPTYGWSSELIDDGRWECAFDQRLGVSLPYIRREVNNTHYYDLITPYGYGGLSAAEGASTQDKAAFRRAFIDQSRQRGLVAEFFRLSPLDDHPEILSTTTLHAERPTYGAIVHDPVLEFQNSSGKHRTAVRKAAKMGVTIQVDSAESLTDPTAPFREVYRETMARVDARNSLRLEDDYFERLSSLGENITVVQAQHEGHTVAAAIFMKWHDRIHYHLSGSTVHGRRLQATSAILAHTVNAQSRLPFSIHLGGGVTADDPLSKFKRSSSSREFTMTSTKAIINPAAYDRLTEHIASPSTYFPAYRDPNFM